MPDSHQISESPRVVVTGASRGIGLAFCRQYASRGMDVYAVCRTASEALTQLPVTIISDCDLLKPDTLSTIPKKLKGASIDLLINNAGILHNEVLGSIDYASIEQQFQVNSLGPLRVTEILLSYLTPGAKVALVTSRMGSIADNSSGGRYGYRMSKAALNIAGVSLAHDLKSRSIAVGIYHPGLVGTDMIGGHGDITPDQAAERLIARIDALDLESSGQFWHSNGTLLPW